MRSIALYYKIHDDNTDGHDNTNGHDNTDGHDNNTDGHDNINDKKATGSDNNVEFHINIWKVEKGHYKLTPNLYFDFGIKAKFKIEKLCLYLPFEIDEKGFEDLGKVLHNQKELLSTVFNDEVNTTTLSNDCYCKVQLSNPKDEFYLYQLGSLNKKITCSDEGDNTKGSFIEITINGTPDDGNRKDKECFYVRFRVKVKDVKQVVITQHLSNDLLQAAFSAFDLYDIRINELREVHPKVMEKMKIEKYQICYFSKIHIFYMADIHEVIENGSSLKQDSRILEDKKWCSYEPKTDLHNSIFIAHHWKRRQKSTETSIKSFSLFFSTVYPEIQILRLIVYILVVVILGFFGGLLSFSFDEIGLNKMSTWIKPVIVVTIFFFIIIYILNTNFGCKIGSIFRKR